jgi:hypothetical protein
MTASSRIPWFAGSRVAARVVALALLVGAIGCKGKDGGSSGGMTKNDPLIGGPGRIPKQNVPVPDRGTATGPKGRGDPLLGMPTGSTRANAGGYADDPNRWKGGPYVPGPGGSPAALAGRPTDSDEGLKIETPGVGLTPAGGTAAPTRPIAPSRLDNASDTVFGRLAKYGVKRGDYSLSREDGLYIVRVKVPISDSGPSRAFTGQGSTEVAAVQQVVDQITSAK